MKVNQISGMLNDVFASVLGDDIFSEDLSNIVDAGKIITGSDVFGENFDNYASKIIDKVGRTIFWDRVYNADDLGIWRDSWEYGSVLEKIRCEVGEYTDNCEWDLTKDANSNGTLDYNDNIANHIAEIFKFYPASVQAKYFNAKTTFKTTISITRKQLRSAFNGAAEMARFIGMIEQRVRSKMEISKNALQKMVIANLMGEHLAQRKQVIDLKKMYEDEVVGANNGGTLAAALADKTKARYIAQKMTFFREMMTEPSKLYSASGTFWNHTPIEDSRLIVLADVDSALRFNVYGDTFNEEFVKLNNYKVVPFWQTTGKTNTLADRSAIAIKTSNGNYVSRDNIIGVLFDRDAAMICNDEPDVRTQYNPDGNFTNYFYCADCSYYNDFDENAIVFVWGSGEANMGVTLVAGSSATTTRVGSIAQSLNTGEVMYAKSGDAVQTIKPGDTFSSATGWTKITSTGSSGTTVTTAASKVVTVIVTSGEAGATTKVVSVGSATAVVGS